jgi:peptidoglycan/LPS O-acetylase OafA/YrhL
MFAFPRRGHRSAAGDVPAAGRFLLALLLSWLLAEASFRTFERWFLRHKDAWAR